MVRFEALVEDGRPAVRDGAIVLADGPGPTERKPTERSP